MFIYEILHRDACVFFCLIIFTSATSNSEVADQQERQNCLPENTSDSEVADQQERPIVFLRIDLRMK